MTTNSCLLCNNMKGYTVKFLKDVFFKVMKGYGYYTYNRSFAGNF